jgi:hypothetical protein
MAKPLMRTRFKSALRNKADADAGAAFSQVIELCVRYREFIEAGGFPASSRHRCWSLVCLQGDTGRLQWLPSSLV